MIALFLIAAAAIFFALGYTLGETVGWDRCWKDLTENDSWRKEGSTDG